MNCTVLSVYMDVCVKGHSMVHVPILQCTQQRTPNKIGVTEKFMNIYKSKGYVCFVMY